MVLLLMLLLLLLRGKGFFVVDVVGKRLLGEEDLAHGGCLAFGC